MKYTSYQIKDMDADKLRLAVAEAQGFTNVCMDEFGLEIDPIDDISDAMQLVEEAHKAGCDVHMYAPPFDHIDRYYCKFTSRRDYFGEYMSGETLPLAICRSWLLWKGDQ